MFIVNVEGAIRKDDRWLTTEEILNHPQAPSYLKDCIKLADNMFSIL